MHVYTNLDQKQHGTPEFPAEYYYVDHLHPRYQMSVHWHNEWELLRVKAGAFQILLDDEQITAQAGDVLLIRGGVLHGGIPASCAYECFVFDLYGLFRGTEMVKKHLRPFYRQQICPKSFFSSETEPAVCAIADELMAIFNDSAAQDTDCHELETAACICKLFARILKDKCYTPASPEVYADHHRIDQMKEVLEYIEKHYNSGLSLEELAGVVGMNPKYFCRVFAALTHQTPMDYVNFFRIEHAAYLLDSTDLSVTAIGTECGFSESSYFTKVFKKYKGTTPKAYRQLKASTAV